MTEFDSRYLKGNARLFRSGPPRALLAAVVTLLFLAPWGHALAAILPDIDRERLTTELEFLEDPEGQLELRGALADDSWQPNGDQTFSRGYNASAWWLRFSFTNPDATPSERLLSISYPVLRDVRVHTRHSGGDWETLEMGNKYPFSQRPLDHRFFVVPIDWQPGETVEVYIRVQSSSSVQVPLDLWKPEPFYSHTTFISLAQGIYIGALLAILAFNFLLYLVLRDRNYLYYVATIICMILLISSINGYTFRLLWPNAPAWNNQATIFFMALSPAFAGLFTRRFLELDRFAPVMAKVMSVVILVAFVMAGLGFLLPYLAAVSFLIPFTVVACIAALLSGVVAWRSGQSSARFYLLAWTFLLVGLITLTLSKAGILPSNALTDASGQIGSLAEVILLSFALAQRINIERRLRSAAQAESLDASRRHNQELEARVQARTDELKQLNKQLGELSVTDSLTGLRNRRYFDEALGNELHRGRRAGRPLSVALLDIDHFKKLNDTHGHQAGDECLRQLARVLEQSLRAPSDTAARYGGEEFVLILAETDAEAGLAVLERVRAAIARLEVHYQDLCLTFTVSAGLATAGVGADIDAGQLLKQADDALYRAKATGRNRICVAGEADTAAVLS